ncbi:aldehyde dehydrogenase [Fictibacillus aquaticus]|uniref:Aldehyde dehydrogenase n=1 Tax=Fictibacillus aquaticus TaxID=2021314 RepID=A0A235F4R4_9BACL|nr:aldehyde dehydrogenase [Fictibacillus aquaticus]OYD56249.1 aldehyde dehydrogenase [Fictibacillus aquaticus]
MDTQLKIEELLKQHKQFFNTGRTRDIEFRLHQLKKLKLSIQRNEKEIIKALYTDLRKSEFEAYGSEIGFTLDSINYMIKNLKKWSKPQKVKTPIHQFPSKSYILSEPYGTVLIIGPFNYPFQLLIEPLIGAIAAGNNVVLKPSESTPSVSAVINKIVQDTFEENYITVIEGEKETTSLLIHAKFDYIFFTGSVPVGKIVMEAAAKNLVPVTLELGGKSPVIVDSTANLDIAAKRIAWGKFLNAGQTCIAPDYVLAHSSIKDDLIKKMTETLEAFYGTDSSSSSDYGRIVNERQFDRLAAILKQDSEKIVFGGKSDRDDLYIEPAILHNVTWNDASMEDEIFGPILPVLEYSGLDEAIESIQNSPKPLALYVFTENEAVEKKILSSVSFGGGCVNDTLSHIVSPHLPFGGVGTSGLGAYHGKYSFDVFSHKKSILKKSTKIESGLVFPPYGDKVKWLRKLLK